MDVPEIEAPTAAQKHAAAVEQAALKMAAGVPARRASDCLPRDGLSPEERSDLMVAAILRANQLIRRNLWRNRLLGIIWCACGIVPLLFYAFHWFRDGSASWILLIIGFPALVQGYRQLTLKPTEPAEPD